MNNQISKNSRYDSIDGLRLLACFGIVLMHIQKNINYSLNNDLLDSIIGQFGNFVFLFMIISSFGICCGYYNKIKNKEISPEDFYSKRIKKILPFFSFLVLLDVILEHNISSIIEGFANLTLLFNFLQKNITVIGVSWFLGLIFMFYIIFPYFTYLFSTKKKAWITTIFSLLMTLSCIYYFNVGRQNMFYSFIYFCVGGMVYLYKDTIISSFSKNRCIGFLLLVISIVLYFVLPIKNPYLEILRTILISGSLLCYSISYDSKLLNNKLTCFVGNISFEIYLCHMVIYRVLEKLNLTHLLNNNLLSYFIVFVLVICGSIFIAIMFNKIYLIFTKNKDFKKQRKLKA